MPTVPRIYILYILGTVVQLSFQMRLTHHRQNAIRRDFLVDQAVDCGEGGGVVVPLLRAARGVQQLPLFLSRCVAITNHEASLSYGKS